MEQLARVQSQRDRTLTGVTSGNEIGTHQCESVSLSDIWTHAMIDATG